MVGDFHFLYCRYAVDKVEHKEARASSHEVEMFDRVSSLFEVRTGYHYFNSKGGNKQIIRLNDRTCTCGKWQEYGIPCSHVIAACSKWRIDYWAHVEPTYLVSEFSKCYAPQFQPIPHEARWPNPNFPIIHPDKTKLCEPGRPKSTRIRNEMDWREPGTKNQCGLCKQEGHNRRKCPSRQVVAPP